MSRPKRKQRSSVRLTWDSKVRLEGSFEEGVLNQVLKTAEVVLPLTPSAQGRYRPELEPEVSPDRMNRLIHGDNLSALSSLIGEGLASSVDLIYIDPPFLSNSNYHHRITVDKEVFTLKRPSYRDRWTREAYLDMIYPRLRLMHRLLGERGKIFVHCDWRTNSLIRLLLDEIFGAENFLNEIVWSYGGRGAKATSGQFARNHDTILVYGRSRKARLKKVYVDRVLTEDEARSIGCRTDESGRFFKTAPRGDYTDESVKALERQGRIYRTRSGNIRIKYFMDRRGEMVVEKRPVGDVWDDIPDAMHSPLRERTGFPTQKPEMLLERIIESATEKGDFVCDLFGGSGTTAVVAERMGRRWIVCEGSAAGVQVARARLITECAAPFAIERVASDGEKDAALPAGGSLLILDGPVIDGGRNGNIEITLGIKDYRIDDGACPVLPDPVRKDPLLLIDYWAVDWDYDHRIFRSRWQSIRGNGKRAGRVAATARALLTDRPRTLAVRAVDIFGNETEVVTGLGKDRRTALSASCSGVTKHNGRG